MATKIKLASSDGSVFEVDEEVANESQTIKSLLEDAGNADDVVPLPNVASRTLGKVIEYCRYHVDNEKKGDDDKPVKTAEEMKKWDEEWIKVDQRELFDIILAANYLNIEKLLTLTVETVAQMIKGKTPQEIRQQFNIKNDFTPEEEAEVNREGQWSFD